MEGILATKTIHNNDAGFGDDGYKICPPIIFEIIGPDHLREMLLSEGWQYTRHVGQSNFSSPDTCSSRTEWQCTIVLKVCMADLYHDRNGNGMVVKGTNVDAKRKGIHFKF